MVVARWTRLDQIVVMRREVEQISKEPLKIVRSTTWVQSQL